MVCMDRKLAEFESDYRDKSPDESICDYYCDLRSRQLKSGSIRIVNSAWNRLQEFMTNESEKGNDLKFQDLDADSIDEFITFLRDHDDINKDSTIEKHIGNLSGMISWFNKKGMMSGNPFQTAKDNTELETGSTKVPVPNDELRNGIANIQNPLLLVVVTVLLKTGLRISEFVNLDERDIYLDHSIEERLDDYRTDLVGKPDSIYVDSRINRGEEWNEEVRHDSNKGNSSRVIPLDHEVKQVLVWYLAMRPAPDSQGNPLFISNRGGNDSSIGSRISSVVARNLFNEWSDAHGWYDADDPSSVKPHWCRHWFTTTIRSNVNEDLIEVGTKDDFEDYLRGDTSSDTKDDYIQMSWGSNHWMNKTLEDALPPLLTSPQEEK